MVTPRRVCQRAYPGRVKFVVLVSKPESPYADTSRSYEYPARYRRFFAPLESGEPMIAILYGPDDDRARRMAFIGWTALRERPHLSERPTVRGEPQWEVTYVDDIQYFPNPVPFRLMGEAVERWVREWPIGFPDMRGRSVRDLEEPDARRVLELGYAGSLPTIGEYQTNEDDATLLAAERATRLVEAVARDARFRLDVVAAYQNRCAITGLAAGDVSRRKAARLLDAAHIRPVGDHGPDVVGNGLALTPTVHRLFDDGLITVRWASAALELITSPLLDPRMISAPERGTVISLESGAKLLLPSDRAEWPKRDLVRYHQTQVFKGPASTINA